MMALLNPLNQSQQKGLSPGDIMHVNEQEGQLLNAYLKDTFVRKVASVSQLMYNLVIIFLNNKNLHYVQLSLNHPVLD